MELGQDFPFLAAIPIGSRPLHSQSASDPYVLPDPCRRNAPAPFPTQHLQASLSASSASSIQRRSGVSQFPHKPPPMMLRQAAHPTLQVLC